MGSFELGLGLYSWQHSKARKAEAEAKALRAQLAAQSTPQAEDEAPYTPYVPCTFPGCILEARGKHFNHTHIKPTAKP
jgi:hypothetical protein